MGALGGAGLMLARGLPAALAAPTSFAPYAVPLPVPPKARPGADGVYRLSAEQFTQALHPNLPAVKVWGYNDGRTRLYPGPTIEMRKDDSTTVRFTNKLPAKHLLPVDPAVAGERGTVPRILTHLHGGFVAGASDGNPYATQDEYARGETQTVTYPPHPRATMLWYHDHALGMTRLNVYAGLAGFLRIRDNFDTGAEPNPLGIPGGRYEVPIVLQDKSFLDGQLFYSATRTWIPEFFGDTPMVNGAVQPFLKVEPRKYRLTFLNGSQSRFYHLELGGGPPFYQIGSEGGMFDEPVSLKSILLLPAQRADVIVYFGGLDGQDIVLKNRALPAGVVSPATPTLPSLMQFRVRGPVTKPGPQTIPTALAGGSRPNLAKPVKRRYITLEEVLDPADNPTRLELNGRGFDEPVDEAPAASTIEDWSFVNISADTHPIHMHLTNFQVMGRARLVGRAYAAALAAARAGKSWAPPLLANNTIDPAPFVLGPEVRPAPNERGWKDTVGANPNQVTRIRQRFDLPAGASVPQKYVYHCHILEHEDNDMMRPYKVV
jgi:spore coat protein A